MDLVTALIRIELLRVKTKFNTLPLGVYDDHNAEELIRGELLELLRQHTLQLEIESTVQFQKAAHKKDI
jgi:hypothetical protein